MPEKHLGNPASEWHLLEQMTWRCRRFGKVPSVLQRIAACVSCRRFATLGPVVYPKAIRSVGQECAIPSFVVFFAVRLR